MKYRNREITHLKPESIPFKEARKYRYITACGRKINTGDDAKPFLRFSPNKRKVTCKQCKNTKIFK